MINDPNTWGSLTKDEASWAKQFHQGISWEEYQELRKSYKPGYGAQINAMQLPIEGRYNIERRNRIAEDFAFALASAGNGWGDNISKRAVELTDALIAELDK